MNLIFGELSPQTTDVLGSFWDLRLQARRVSQLWILLVHTLHLLQRVTEVRSGVLFRKLKLPLRNFLDCQQEQEFRGCSMSPLYSKCPSETGKAFLQNVPNQIKASWVFYSKTSFYFFAFFISAGFRDQIKWASLHLWSCVFCRSLLMSSIFAWSFFFLCSGGRCEKSSAAGGCKNTRTQKTQTSTQIMVKNRPMLTTRGRSCFPISHSLIRLLIDFFLNFQPQKKSLSPHAIPIYIHVQYVSSKL